MRKRARRASGASNADARAGTAGVNAEVGLSHAKTGAEGFGRAGTRCSGAPGRWGWRGSSVLAWALARSGISGLRPTTPPWTLGRQHGLGPRALADGRALQDPGPRANTRLRTSDDLPDPRPSRVSAETRAWAEPASLGTRAVSRFCGNAGPGRGGISRKRHRFAFPRRRGLRPSQHLSAPTPLRVSTETPARAESASLGTTPLRVSAETHAWPSQPLSEPRRFAFPRKRNPPRCPRRPASDLARRSEAGTPLHGVDQGRCGFVHAPRWGVPGVPPRADTARPATMGTMPTTIQSISTE
jgi:hypothetical protein